MAGDHLGPTQPPRRWRWVRGARLPDRLTNLGESVAGFVLEFAGRVLAVLIVVGAVGLIAGFVGSIQQRSVQRGIDAHAVALDATYTRFIPGRSKFREDAYEVSYVYQDWQYRPWLSSLSGQHRVGDQLCVEIDASRPENARICGTRGGHEQATTRLEWAGGLLAFLVVLGIVAQRAPVPGYGSKRRRSSGHDDGRPQRSRKARRRRRRPRPRPRAHG